MTQLDPSDLPETGHTRFETGGAHADPQQPTDPVDDGPDPRKNTPDYSNEPSENVPTYPDGKLPGQENLETLPQHGKQRGETPVVTDEAAPAWRDRGEPITE